VSYFGGIFGRFTELSFPQPFVFLEVAKPLKWLRLVNRDLQSYLASVDKSFSTNRIDHSYTGTAVLPVSFVIYSCNGQRAITMPQSYVHCILLGLIRDDVHIGTAGNVVPF